MTTDHRADVPVRALLPYRNVCGDRATELLEICKATFWTYIDAGMPHNRIGTGRVATVDVNEAREWIAAKCHNWRGDRPDHFRVIPLMEAAARLGIDRKVVMRRESRWPGSVIRKGRLVWVDLDVFEPKWKEYCERPKRATVRRSWMQAGVDMRSGVIYAIIDPISKRPRYIGKAADHKKRWGFHKSELARGRHGNRHLQNWYNSLPHSMRGKIRFCIMQECLPGTMDQCEAEWISRGRAKGWKLCNIMNAPTGVGALSDETRAKLSAISKAKWQDPEYVAHRRANPGGVASKLSPEERERRRQQKERNRAIRARHLKIAARRRVERESLKTLTPLMCQGKVMLPVGRNGNGASHRQAKNARSFFWFAIEPALWETVKGHLWHVKTNVTGNATYYSPRATIDGAKVAIGTIARRLGIDGPTPMRHGVTPDCSAKMHVST